MFSKLTLLCRVLPAFAIGLPALATQPGPQAWSLLAPAGTRPTPRQSPRIAYNPNTNRLILYGGYANMIAGPDAVPGDVWVLTHANGLGGTPEWIQSIPAFAPGSPPRRLDAETIYDPPSNRLILIGGLDPELPPGFCCISGVLNDVWILHNADGTGGSPYWQQVFPGGDPLRAERAPVSRTTHPQTG